MDKFVGCVVKLIFHNPLCFGVLVFYAHYQQRYWFYGYFFK